MTSMRDLWVVVPANNPDSVDDGDPIYLSAVDAAKAMVKLNADQDDETNGFVYVVISLADKPDLRRTHPGIGRNRAEGAHAETPKFP